jgi:hypothetical protein
LPVFELPGAFDHPEIDFVHHGGALQSVISPLALQAVVRDASEFGINQRHERVERGLIPFSPFSKELCHPVGFSVRQGLPPNSATRAQRMSRPYPNCHPKSTL